MEQRIYHGTLTPNDFARVLISEFNRGNLVAQQLGDNDQVMVQIATRQGAAAGGKTALCVSLNKVADGVAVDVGKQAWLGVAASLGMMAFTALRNPLVLIGHLDDIAQDIENIQLNEQVWATIDETARNAGASMELSERLKRAVCPYCNTANPVGEPACIACGAPLGDIQPGTCPKCGFVVRRDEHFCPNCGQPL
ncbi:MAG: zinc-ribbon domain-containing protein [Omnitrophica WOR_2 bacterium]